MQTFICDVPYTDIETKMRVEIVPSAALGAS